MTIWEAYETYKIMPNLRLHQLRVAAIARTLARARMVDPELVTKAGLLHDMGNIMKSDLGMFPPEFYGEHDRAYWEAVKAECGARFGFDEHDATVAIVRDIGLGEDVVELIAGMGFSKAKSVLEHGALDLQILEYADSRVAPYSIVSMEERLREGHDRYVSRMKVPFGSKDTVFEENLAILHDLESKLFEGLMLKPADLNESSLQSEIAALREYRIA